MQDHFKAERRQQDETNAFKKAVSQGIAGMPVPKQTKPKHGRVTGKLNLQSSKKYCPARSYLYHCPHSARIRGFYGSGRKSVQGNLSLGMDLAVRLCLVGLWALYEIEHPGSKCPYDFGDLTVRE